VRAAGVGACKSVEKIIAFGLRTSMQKKLAAGVVQMHAVQYSEIVNVH
jgi:hypothetical protein